MSTQEPNLRVLHLADLHVKTYTSINSSSLQTSAGEVLSQHAHTPEQTPELLQYQLLKAAMEDTRLKRGGGEERVAIWNEAGKLLIAADTLGHLHEFQLPQAPDSGYAGFRIAGSNLHTPDGIIPATNISAEDISGVAE